MLLDCGRTVNKFQQKLDLVGNAFGVLGTLMCVTAMVLRVVLGAGNPEGVRFSPRSILWMGTAALGIACFFKLAARDR